MANAELGEKGIDGPELQPGSSAGIPEACRFDMIAPVWHDQRQCRKSPDDLVTRAGARESLQQLLEDQAGRYDGPTGMQRVGERVDFRCGLRRITAQCERPHARVDQKAQRRVRSAL